MQRIRGLVALLSVPRFSRPEPWRRNSADALPAGRLPSHLFCTPLRAKCFHEEERCEGFPPLDHLKSYKIAPSGPPVNEKVVAIDHFGEETLKVGTAQFLCLPANKRLLECPCGPVRPWVHPVCSPGRAPSNDDQ